MSEPTKVASAAPVAPPPELGVDPLANLFPLMSDDELKVLADDIGIHGQREPITLYIGRILDGRNRYRACKIAGKEPRTVELPNSVDPIAFVVSANLHRRHLNETQRGIVAAKLANMRRGGKEANPSKDGIDPVAQAAAAKLLNVSTKTVERAAKLLKANIPDLVTAAEQGTVKVSTANKYVKMKDDDKKKLLVEKGGLVEAVQSLGKRGVGGSSTTTNTSDAYGAVEKDLLAKLSAMDANTAEAAAQETINKLASIVRIKKPEKFTLKIAA